MKLPVLSTNDFSWDKETKTFIADFTNITEFVRLQTLNIRYSPTEGFYLKSAKTGIQMLCLYDEAEAMQNEFWDGERWEFFSPSSDKFRVIIIND